MPSDIAEMQSTLNLDYFLNDDDCDIQVEYGSVLDAASNMRRKFSSVLRQARQLKMTLQAKQAELEHERQRPNLREIAETNRNKLRQQSRRLRQCKDDNKSLRLRNRELADELEVARKELEKVDHLRCNICMISSLNSNWFNKRISARNRKKDKKPRSRLANGELDTVPLDVTTQSRARVEDFTVCWICALHIELTAAREALDKEFGGCSSQCDFGEYALFVMSALHCVMVKENHFHEVKVAISMLSK
ncbi:hypothetical protein LTR06_011538, partial [Exophiala xenobiotica]